MPKIKLNFLFSSIKYFYVLIIIMMAFALSLLSLFLYQNLYKSITQSEQIILLKQEVAPDTIDLARVDSVLSALKQKVSQKTINWLEIKNFFIYPIRNSTEN